jgi:outer membrane protein assembly factor BamB
VTAGWDGQVSCFSGKALLALRSDTVWTKAAGGRVTGPPEIGEFDPAAGVEVVAVTDKKALVFALKTGEERRSIPLPFAPTSWRIGAKHLVIGSAEQLAAIRLSDGEVAWSTPMKTAVTAIGAPGDIGGKTLVVIGTEEGTVLAFDLPTGVELWTSRLEQTVKSAPVIADLDADGTPDVALGCDSGRVYVLDGRTGVARWYAAAGGKVQAEVSIADLTGDGLPEIIFGTKDGGLGAVSLSSK